MPPVPHCPQSFQSAHFHPPVHSVMKWYSFSWNHHVVWLHLNRGSTFFLALMLSGVLSNGENQLEDFPACGFRNEDSSIHPFIPEQVQRRDECLWDCKWVPNPFYRVNWTLQLVDEYLKNQENPDEKIVFKDVKYFMMTPKIPEDLTCLDGCRLQEFVSKIKHCKNHERCPVKITF